MTLVTLESEMPVTYGTPAACEVRDNRLRVVQRFVAIAGAAPEQLALSSGAHVVSAQLPNGEYIDASVPERTEPDVLVELKPTAGDASAGAAATTPIDHARATAAELMKAARGAWRQEKSGARPLRTGGAALRWAAQARPRAFRVVVWRRQADGRWHTYEMHRIRLGEAITVGGEAHSRFAVGCSGPGFPSRIVEMPPSRARFVVASAATGDDDPAPYLRLIVEDRLLNATAAHLWNGRLTAAETLLRAPYAPPADELPAILRAYHRLTSSDVQAEEHESYPEAETTVATASDILTVNAWLRLRQGPDASPVEGVRELLLAGEESGPPCFTTGLRLLLKGLELLAASDLPVDDLHVIEALERTRAFAGATIWDEPATTFYGQHPAEPMQPVRRRGGLARIGDIVGAISRRIQPSYTPETAQSAAEADAEERRAQATG